MSPAFLVSCLLLLTQLTSSQQRDLPGGASFQWLARGLKQSKNDIPVDKPNCRCIPGCTAETRCPADFNYIAAVNGCYKVINVKQTWSSASRECASYPGAHLLHINSRTEQDHISTFLNQFDDAGSCTVDFSSVSGLQVWIGGQRVDPSTNSTFVWKTSSHDGNINPYFLGMTYAKWCRNQPDYWHSSESCLELRQFYQFAWNDMACSKQLCSVCEIDL